VENCFDIAVENVSMMHFNEMASGKKIHLLFEEILEF